MFDIYSLAGLIGALLSIGSYFQRTHRNITITAALAQLAWCIYFVVEFDLTTSALCVLAFVRIIIGVYIIHMPLKFRNLLTLLVSGVIIGVTMITWKNNLSMVPMLASLIMTYAGYNLTYPKLRQGLLAGEFIWWLNALILGQYISLLSCSICMLVNVVILYRERHVLYNYNIINKA